MVKYPQIDLEILEVSDCMSRQTCAYKFSFTRHTMLARSWLNGPNKPRCERPYLLIYRWCIVVFGERVTPNSCEQRNISRITTCINMYVSIIFVKWYNNIICYDIDNMMWYTWYVHHDLLLVAIIVSWPFCQNSHILCAKTWCRIFRQFHCDTARSSWWGAPSGEMWRDGPRGRGSRAVTKIFAICCIEMYRVNYCMPPTFYGDCNKPW